MSPLLLAVSLVPGYQAVSIAGWTLQVEPKLIHEHPKLWEAVRVEATRQLEGIARVVPDGPLAKLRQITFWIHIDSPTSPCMAFHPEAGWLREHGGDPRMAGGVEMGNAANFVSWTYEQPWMMLHELSHAYHFTFLPKGFDNPDIAATYDNAMAKKLYDNVLHWDGKMTKAYATNNRMEYFAEISEAYFGMNDFYPFNRAELMNHDPEAYALLRKVWGDPQKRVPTD